MPISKSVFKKFLQLVPLEKVIAKSKSADQGHRLWPSRTSKNDQKYNFRVDQGATLADGKQQMIIQANKNAENAGVKESAQKDSHRVVAMVTVDPENDPSGSNVEDDALASFEKNQAEKFSQRN